MRNQVWVALPTQNLALTCHNAGTHLSRRIYWSYKKLQCINWSYLKGSITLKETVFDFCNLPLPSHSV